MSQIPNSGTSLTIPNMPTTTITLGQHLFPGVTPVSEYDTDAISTGAWSPPSGLLLPTPPPTVSSPMPIISPFDGVLHQYSDITQLPSSSSEGLAAVRDSDRSGKFSDRLSVIMESVRQMMEVMCLDKVNKQLNIFHVDVTDTKSTDLLEKCRQMISNDTTIFQTFNHETRRNHKLDEVTSHFNNLIKLRTTSIKPFTHRLLPNGQILNNPEDENGEGDDIDQVICLIKEHFPDGFWNQICQLMSLRKELAQQYKQTIKEVRETGQLLQNDVIALEALDNCFKMTPGSDSSRQEKIKTVMDSLKIEETMNRWVIAQIKLNCLQMLVQTDCSQQPGCFICQTASSNLLVLYPCAHTICDVCYRALNQPSCPFCRQNIIKAIKPFYGISESPPTTSGSPPIVSNSPPTTSSPPIVSNSPPTTTFPPIDPSDSPLLTHPTVQTSMNTGIPVNVLRSPTTMPLVSALETMETSYHSNPTERSENPNPTAGVTYRGRWWN